MNNVWKLVQDFKPVLLMVLVQITYSSVNVLYKLAINDGMSIRVVTAYRLIFAVVFTFSLAFIFERFILTPSYFFCSFWALTPLQLITIQDEHDSIFFLFKQKEQTKTDIEGAFHVIF